MRVYLFKLASLAGLLGGLVACADWRTDPRVVERDFGNSVRQMIQAQIADPITAANPSSEPPTLVDGNKGSATLGIYRRDVTAPSQAAQPVIFQLGTGTGTGGR